METQQKTTGTNESIVSHGGSELKGPGAWSPDVAKMVIRLTPHIREE